MSSYLKPQTPLYHNTEDAYFYPLTTADQVIMKNGERLNSLFKKTIKENITLLVSGWSESAPYIQTVTLNESMDDYNVDADIMYSGNAASDLALNKAASCLTYVKKNNKEITFYCLNSKPETDVPIEITGTCRNTIATVEEVIKEGIQLNFDIKSYATDAEMLSDVPMENTIGVITDTPITGYRFNSVEPENMSDGELWISTGIGSNITLNIIDCVTVYPIFAKQYIGGVLVDVIAKSYQNGEWVNWWLGELYVSGKEYTETTGGWIFRSSGGNATPYGSKGETGITVGSSSTYPATENNATHNNCISLERFTEVRVHVVTAKTGATSTCVSKIRIMDENDTEVMNTVILNGKSLSASNQWYSMDVSGLPSGFYKVEVHARHTSSSNQYCYVEFDEVKCV